MIVDIERKGSTAVSDRAVVAVEALETGTLTEWSDRAAAGG
jgi:hypothetical protein